MIKMKKWMEQFRVEDWVVVWVSIPLLALAAVAPSALPKVPATLLGGAAWSNIACLFAIVLVVLYAGCLMLRRPLRGLLASLVVVFAVSLLAQIVAKIPSVSYYGFESVFFSVLFGLLIRNVWRVPAWLKPAIQGEFYIKIGVVCLGATILFSDVMKSGVFGLVQACLVVAVVWFFAFRISRRMKVDERSAMILSSGVSICGVSACITAARVAGARRPETFVHRFAGADRRRADDLSDAVVGACDPAAYFRRSACRAGGRRGVDRRYDRHYVGCRRIEHDRGRSGQPACRHHQGCAERTDRRGGVLHRALPLDAPRR